MPRTASTTGGAARRCDGGLPTCSLVEAAQLAAAIAEHPALRARALIRSPQARRRLPDPRDVGLDPRQSRSPGRPPRSPGTTAHRRPRRRPGGAGRGRRQARGGRPRVLASGPRLRRMGDDNGVDPLGHSSTVWMQGLDAKKPLRHAMHIDVSVAKDQAEARFAAAVAAGGRVVQESGPPATWILADRAGNKVCIAAWPDGAAPVGDPAEGPRRRRRDARGPTRRVGGLAPASSSTEVGEAHVLPDLRRCSCSARGPRSSSGG